MNTYEDLLKEYEEIALELAQLLASKQAAYGDSFGRSGEILRVLFPDGIRPESYDIVLPLTRIIDKIFRLSTGHHEDSWEDIAGYAMLAVAKNRKRASGSPSQDP
ncbi:MAG TPA: hypothetical protein PK659_09040 [Methanothrix sp.]|nr:hypothetical protein [Methanothrix sp.]HOL44382.1 hypothetical protein [Methanothrix sp.]